MTWLTGYAPEIETGPSPFALSAIAVVRRGGAVLVVSEDEAEAAAATGCEVAAYPGFGIGPVDPVGAARRMLADVLDAPTAAIDAGTFPAALAQDLDWVDVGDELARTRAVKDLDEIELIRAAIAVCDAGQRAARAHAAADISELDLWAAVRGAMESPRRLGYRCWPTSSQAHALPRSAGRPTARVLAEGDLVLCDLVPRVAGYWGDSCATFAVGEPTLPRAQPTHGPARRWLTWSTPIRPGAVAGELDALARAQLEFPHHTGHGLGTGYHEEPRIVPGSPAVLEDGMVVAIEPGTYAGAGVRLEQVVLVTAGGQRGPLRSRPEPVTHGRSRAWSSRTAAASRGITSTSARRAASSRSHGRRGLTRSGEAASSSTCARCRAAARAHTTSHS